MQLPTFVHIAGGGAVFGWRGLLWWSAFLAAALAWC
jgi:hypothetical protein